MEILENRSLPAMIIPPVRSILISHDVISEATGTGKKISEFREVL